MSRGTMLGLCMVAALVSLGGAGCVGPVPKSSPDPLDKISGTEDWVSKSADLDQEWKQWQQARSAWRAALKEARLQRVRNRRVVLLIKRATILDDTIDELRFDSTKKNKKRRRRRR